LTATGTQDQLEKALLNIGATDFFALFLSQPQLLFSTVNQVGFPEPLIKIWISRSFFNSEHLPPILASDDSQAILSSMKMSLEIINHCLTQIEKGAALTFDNSTECSL
jgi:hypothetical protein